MNKDGEEIQSEGSDDYGDEEGEEEFDEETVKRLREQGYVLPGDDDDGEDFEDDIYGDEDAEDDDYGDEDEESEEPAPKRKK